MDMCPFCARLPENWTQSCNLCPVLWIIVSAKMGYFISKVLRKYTKYTSIKLVVNFTFFNKIVIRETNDTFIVFHWSLLWSLLSLLRLLVLNEFVFFQLSFCFLLLFFSFFFWIFFRLLNFLCLLFMLNFLCLLFLVSFFFELFVYLLGKFLTSFVS